MDQQRNKVQNVSAVNLTVREEEKAKQPKTEISDTRIWFACLLFFVNGPLSSRRVRAHAKLQIHQF